MSEITKLGRAAAVIALAMSLSGCGIAREMLERGNDMEVGTLVPVSAVQMAQVTEEGCAFLILDRKLRQTYYRYQVNADTELAIGQSAEPAGQGQSSGRAQGPAPNSASQSTGQDDPKLLDVSCAKVITIGPDFTPKLAEDDNTDQASHGATTAGNPSGAATGASSDAIATTAPANTVPTALPAAPPSRAAPGASAPAATPAGAAPPHVPPSSAVVSATLPPVAPKPSPNETSSTSGDKYAFNAETQSESIRLAGLGEIYTNDVCKLYFDGLDRVASGADFTKGELSVFLNAVTALMGVLQTSSDQLTVLAVTNGAITTTLDNAGKLYLFSPAPSLIYPNVKAAFEKYKTAHPRPTGSASYTDVHEWTQEYARICTPESIRSIVETVMQQGVHDTAAATAALSERRSQANGVLQKMGFDLKGARLTDSQAAGVAWIQESAAELERAQKSKGLSPFETALASYLPPSYPTVEDLLNFLGDPKNKKAVSDLTLTVARLKQDYDDIVNITATMKTIDDKVNQSIASASATAAQH